MAWAALFVAGILEVVWAAAMKQSEGFSRLGPTALTVAAFLASVGLLAWAMRVLPLSTAYVVWTGIGAVGAFTVGVVLLGEVASIARLVAAILIFCGIVLMRVAG